MDNNKGKNNLPEEDLNQRKLREQYNAALDSIIELNTNYTKEELEHHLDGMFQNACASERIIETESLADQSAFWGNLKKLFKALPGK